MSIKNRIVLIAGISFVLLWFVNILSPLSIGSNVISFVNYAERLWFLSMIIIASMALVVIWKERYLSHTHLIIAGFLAILVWNPLGSVVTFLTYYGGTAIFQKTTNRIVLLRGRIWNSLLIGFAVGLPLAGINVFMAIASNTMEIDLANPFWAAFAALRPGISEEIIFRYFIYALLVRGFNDCFTKRQARLSLALLIVPHVLLHLPDVFMTNPGNAIVSTVFLSLLFGLPMALLQLRRDLLSAIALHYLIDFVRFFLFGA